MTESNHRRPSGDGERWRCQATHSSTSPDPPPVWQAQRVTILIDEARWYHRDMYWCHLVSDRSLAELHRFAERHEIPRRGFHGDHYDIPERYRAQLVAAGATEVSSRELVRRLRAAGLRVSPAQRRRVLAERL